jgi:hypothetical protein
MAKRIMRLNDGALEETIITDPNAALRDHYNRLLKNASIGYGNKPR